MTEHTIANCLSCCRLCLSEKHEELSNVFDEDSTLLERISHNLSVDITNSDKLSTLVCAQCVEKINTWHAYKEECTLNQNKLEMRKENFASLNEINPTEPTTELNSHDFRVIFFYNFKRGLLAKQCHEEMEDILGTNCVSLSNTKRWYKKFRRGIFELDSKYGRKDQSKEISFAVKNVNNVNNNTENQETQQRYQEKQSNNKSSDDEDSQFYENIQIKQELQMDDDIDHQHTEEVEPEAPELHNGDIMNESMCIQESRIKPEPVEEEFSEFPPELTPNDSFSTPEFNMLESEESQTSTSNGVYDSHSCRYCHKRFSSLGNRMRHEKHKHRAPRESHIGLEIEPEDSQTSESQEAPEKVVQKVIDEAEQEKIQFAAGLKLLQKDAPIISMEALSKIELSYIEKCKAMVTMHTSLVCACHNTAHTHIKGLLSHLRALRIWFPVFTCYNCMITFTDRSTFTRHMVNCKKTALEAITSLSNLKKRSEVKTRLYQNYKCTECKFMYSFHDEFCKHVDEVHINEPPYVCKCSRAFSDIEEYKDHVYVSCLVQFYCDICFVTVKSLEAFVKHAQDKHDNSEGFILLQDDGYKLRKSLPVKDKVEKVENESKNETKEVAPETPEVVTTKRRSSFYNKSVKEMIEPEPEPEPREIKRRKPMLNAPPMNNEKPGLCPLCPKEYSSYHNMLRHWKTHGEENSSVQTLNDSQDDTSIYSCPDCGGMFNTSEWQKHLSDHHEAKTCSDCGKMFQFASELEQHRSVHLNLKISRDSKTHSYRSTMMSPNQENSIVMVCEVCDGEFATKNELILHKIQVHNFTKDEPIDGAEPAQSKKGNFSCLECDKHYSGYSGLWDHKRRKHPEVKNVLNVYPKKCKICDKMLSSGAAYNNHKAMHDRMSQKMDPPILKPVVATDTKDKKKPVNNEDDEDYHTCKKCFKVFANRSNLKNHMKCHGISPTGKSKNNKKVWCDICHLSCSNEDALRKHKEEEHNMDEDMPDLESEIDNLDAKFPLLFTCDICVMTFSTKNGLKKHKETHKSEKPVVGNSFCKVYCKHCKISFDNVPTLTSHMNEEHDEQLKTKGKPKDNKNFACSVCSKSYDNASALVAHLGWHRRQPNAKSVLKSMKFQPTESKVVKQKKVIDKIASANVSKLKDQKITPPEFQCTTCLQELPNDTALQIHILEKHRNIDAIMLVPRCNICNQDFNSQDEYETHKRLHDLLERQKKHNQTINAEPNNPVPTKKNKSLQCKFCPMTFSKQDTLSAHTRLKHRELMPTEFKCTYCDRVFEKANSLSIHIKVHEKNKNSQQVNNAGAKSMFSCSICYMGFDLPKDLRAHTINAHPF